MEEKDLNFNYSECVKSYSSWGTTHYVNICNGAKNDIPWGVAGYFLMFGGVVFILCLIVMIGLLVRTTIDW